MPLVSLFLWKSLEYLKAKLLEAIHDIETETVDIVSGNKEQRAPNIAIPPYEKAMSIATFRHKINELDIPYEDKRNMLKLLRSFDDSK